MAMLGGLDCIAMAVEHLERSEQAASSTAKSEAAVESPAPAPPAHQGPQLAPPLFARAVSASHNLCEPYPAGFAQLQPPTQSPFVPQYRVVSVSDVEADSRSHDPAPVVKLDCSVDTEHDAKQIDELRQLIFQTDLAKWSKLPETYGLITEVTSTDVLCGRGGETNHHKGNITFRACVKACQPAYIEAKRREKPYIAQRIVLFIRQMGGRFLKRERDASVDAWKDVGNNKAREKTSQALREGAPELRGDPKEGGSMANSVPSVVLGSVSVAHPYPEYGSVPEMVTVSPAYDPRLAVMHPPIPPPPHMLYTQGPVDSPSSRRASKKQRRVSYYAEAAGAAVLAHCHRPSVVPVMSATSLVTLQDDHRPPSQLPEPRASGYPSEMLIPGSPRVTVSADEEERSNPPSPATARLAAVGAVAGGPGAAVTLAASVPHRAGPRLKLLKKRLLSEDHSESTASTHVDSSQL